MSRPVPHWLSCGFRPFFLFGALAMALGVLAWLPMLTGAWMPPTAFAPRDWHVHFLLFGALMAIVAGFALTAVGHWTGRPPVAGRTLGALLALWLAGRVAVTVSAAIGPLAAALVDLAFPAALVAVFAREVAAAGNLKNLPIVGMVGLFGLADAAFHWEAAAEGLAAASTRAGVAILLMLVIVIGGRIIPTFTRNWLGARRLGPPPPSFGRFDALAVAISAIALAAWAAAPGTPAAAVALLAAGFANAVRLARWRGLATFGEPLLAVLHLGYATVPLGFAALGWALLDPAALDPTAALHVWLVGTFGSMTLAVMTRASRGHSGRRLAADGIDVTLYALVFAGTAARVAAPFADGAMQAALDAAGGFWILAFLGFAARYAPILLGPPVDA